MCGCETCATCARRARGSQTKWRVSTICKIAPVNKGRVSHERLRASAKIEGVDQIEGVNQMEGVTEIEHTKQKWRR